MPGPSWRDEPACRRDPDRWFDKRNRRYALEQCLYCPWRSWCAGQALADKRNWGMWAGIWIDVGKHRAVADRLRAIANPGTDPRHAGDAAHSPTPPLLGVSSLEIAPPVSVAALVEMRCAGHCEVMASRCRYTHDRIRSRITDCEWRQAGDASLAYAVCVECDAELAGLDRAQARRLGYLVDSGSDAADVPFFWRQTHWRLLKPNGTLAKTAAAA
ncbi:hypothetical protein BST20_17400 [Mycobacterium branderi]|uniref:4Fe-4S Wbl-type domain-containing protein n=1 Tax=Mycobacterium branderi TaxID=43348 RepID=A0AA91LVD0_9MYCO|nr:hypothetical protein BST20_17400 [Mycobacterium branderi]